MYRHAHEKRSRKKDVQDKIKSGEADDDDEADRATRFFRLRCWVRSA